MTLPALAGDASLAGAVGRRAAHDRIDTEIASWCGRHRAGDVLTALQDAGVPAEPVASAYDIDQDEQLLARRFFEEVDHPVVGMRPYPGWPMRLSGGPDRWYRSPAPLLGQHTEEILSQELGMSADDLVPLREAKVIGDHLVRG